MFCATLLSACASADKEVSDAAKGFKIGFTSRWGPEEKWTQEQKELYLVELYNYLHSRYPGRQATRVTSKMPEYNPYIASGGVDPTSMLYTPKQSGLGIRTWHNSDGSSGQYVPYPGGNGGTIYNSDGTVTTIDPAIGH
jgi:hypothetical protein